MVVRVPQFADRIAEATGLDSAAKPLAKNLAKVVPPGPVKDLLSGSWLGHPVHPMLTDIPIGAWTSAFFLDLLGGKRGRRASQQLVGIGVVAALPTAAAGISDWVDYLGGERRVGFVHAVANVTALSFYSLSWMARRRGANFRGVALGMLGATAATVGGYLGGHLTYTRGVNVNRNAWHEGLDDWTEVFDEAELRDGEPVKVEAGGADVLLVRLDGRLYALGDVCSHAGGPLHEGSIDATCVTCPWHGSMFRLDDGEVVHGPATAAQPTYEVRTEGGKVSVRRAASHG